VTNRAAREGDRLYLTKPIGTGVLATALKKKKLGEDANLALHRNLVSLNRAASEAMLAVGIASATDVTGFGLLGHAAEMARGSNAALEVEALSVPILPDALRLQAKGYVTGGLETNRRYVEDVLHIEGVVDGNLVDLFLDPQTSGGLLIAVAEGKESRFRQALTERQAAAARIGRVVGQGSARIVLR
jgi:selenide,water dikinase